MAGRIEDGCDEEEKVGDVGDAHFLGGEPERCYCGVGEEEEGILCHGLFGCLCNDFNDDDL